MRKREHFYQKISINLGVNPVCAILGPRQCGKTTLALQYAQESKLEYHHFDLENPRHRDQIMANPMLALEDLKGLIILDEIQRCPEVFPVLRYLVDHKKQQFLILGSASRDLIHQSSESLAGRISYLELTPFALPEVQDLNTHWQRGGFPKAFLASSFEESQMWLENYISTFLERDLTTMGMNINPSHMEKLWMMLAHYHGQIINYSEIGKSLELSHTSIKRYTEILEGTFMIRLLKPWHENIAKQQVKTPKIYIRDSGICHYLLDITEKTRLGHPKLGALWEGYALEEIIRKTQVRKNHFYFWKTKHEAEIDLISIHGDRRIGFEFKYADSPKTTRSMWTGLSDLKLDHLYVISPKGSPYRLDEKITSMGLQEFVDRHDQMDMFQK